MFTISFLQTPFRGNQHETIINDRYRCRGSGPGQRRPGGRRIIANSLGLRVFAQLRGRQRGCRVGAVFRQIIVAALHTGVTESQVRTDFAVGNVSKILTQDLRCL